MFYLILFYHDTCRLMYASRAFVCSSITVYTCNCKQHPNWTSCPEWYAHSWEKVSVLWEPTWWFKDAWLAHVYIHFVNRGITSFTLIFYLNQNTQTSSISHIIFCMVMAKSFCRTWVKSCLWWATDPPFDMSHANPLFSYDEDPDDCPQTERKYQFSCFIEKPDFGDQEESPDRLVFVC